MTTLMHHTDCLSINRSVLRVRSHLWFEERTDYTDPAHLSLSEVWGCSGTQLGSRTQGQSLAFEQRTACDCAHGLAAPSPHSWPHVHLHPPPSACSAFLHCKAHDHIIIMSAWRANLNFFIFLCTVPARWRLLLEMRATVKRGWISSTQVGSCRGVSGLLLSSSELSL